MKKTIVLIITHLVAVGFGFMAGVFALPILMAPPAPSEAEINSLKNQSQFQGIFKRDLEDSDLLHWGEGTVAVSRESISLQGEIAPGPDYRLYLSPEFVETEADFHKLKPKMVQVGGVKTFRNFIVPVPKEIDPANYRAVIIWCEAFGQFITAAEYR